MNFLFACNKKQNENERNSDERSEIISKQLFRVCIAERQCYFSLFIALRRCRCAASFLCNLISLVCQLLFSLLFHLLMQFFLFALFAPNWQIGQTKWKEQAKENSCEQTTQNRLITGYSRSVIFCCCSFCRLIFRQANTKITTHRATIQPIKRETTFVVRCRCRVLSNFKNLKIV